MALEAASSGLAEISARAQAQEIEHHDRAGRRSGEEGAGRFVRRFEAACVGDHDHAEFPGLAFELAAGSARRVSFATAPSGAPQRAM